MALYKNILFPMLKRLDPESAHDGALQLLQVAQATAFGCWMLRRVAGAVPHRPVVVCGLRFPNELGIAAGFDKDVRVAGALAELGWGHVEVGTLTPRPQPGNPRPRIFRLPEHLALINRMGFPNGGVEDALPRLRRLARRPRRCPIGVSLGKQKETALEDAAGDYLAVLRRVAPWADYVAVNVSSPNTPGLRALQGPEYLADLLGQLVAEGWHLARRGCMARRPLFVKIAPDLTDEELRQTADAALGAGVDGFIATNTTLARAGVSGPEAQEAGGLSGRPLRRRSTDVVARLRAFCGPAVPIIGAGGVFTVADVREKLDAGACLVQVYTGFVYEGPGMAGDLLRALDRNAG